MDKKTRTRFIAALAAAAVALSLSIFSGCASLGGSDTVVKASPQEIQKSQEAQILAIQNNPNMPDQAKQQAIGAIRANMQVGQQLVSKENQGKPTAAVKK